MDTSIQAQLRSFKVPSPDGYLVLDIAHYAAHPGCKKLWCVIYDPEHYLTNPEGLKDLEGSHNKDGREVKVKVFVVHK